MLPLHIFSIRLPTCFPSSSTPSDVDVDVDSNEYVVEMNICNEYHPFGIRVVTRSYSHIFYHGSNGHRRTLKVRHSGYN